MGCIITYKKSNGDTFVRKYDYTLKKIGEETSMGWTVLDIHYLSHDGNYYHEDDYRKQQKKMKKTLTQKMADYLCRKLYQYR